MAVVIKVNSSRSTDYAATTTTTTAATTATTTNNTTAGPNAAVEAVATEVAVVVAR